VGADKRSGGVLLVVAAMAAVAGCGSATPRPPVKTPVRPRLARRAQRSSPPHRPVRGAARGPKGPPVGASQNLNAGGTRLTVRVAQVFSLGGSGARLLPGNRAVGVNVELHNDGPSVYDSSATGDISIVASSGLATPVFEPSGACQTPLRDFDNYIEPGVSRSGCVAFSLSSRARVLAVRFSPHGQPAGGATWLAR
jgi:hypothetical protein